MSKQAFKAWRPKSDSQAQIDLCNRIITNYQAQGYRLTLRQLYYQLVSRNAIANTEKQYKGLGNLVSRARLAGMMDWSAIEDRVRQPWEPPEYDDLDELVRAALHSYRLPRWHGQPEYAELWGDAHGQPRLQLAVRHVRERQTHRAQRAEHRREVRAHLLPRRP
jgi:hypothetical protein